MRVARVGRVAEITFIWDYQYKEQGIRILSFVVPSWYCRYSHHLPKEEKRFLGRRGEGGVSDLGLLEPRDGGWNHLPGVSGHWCGSESSSVSGVLQGISNTTGGQSSCGMREVEAASGISIPILSPRPARHHAEGSIRGPSPGDSRSTRVR